MLEKELPDLNIFMICQKVNKSVFKELSTEFNIRNCRKNELDIWKGFPFDSQKDKEKYYFFMSDYFNNVDLPYETEF